MFRITIYFKYENGDTKVVSLTHTLNIDNHDLRHLI